jgi:hypothetical protein
VIFIDLEHRRPTDADIPGWTPWTRAGWEAWLAKSRQLVDQLAALETEGKRDERNALIDKNSDHWGALKEWLLALSGGKCWFSEAREVYSHYDVEHFRPKKVAKALDGSERDGYWWLAFDYTNFRVCGNVGNRKKGGWFPLGANSRCSSYIDRCEEDEAVYLLDPINAADVGLLAFDEEGKAICLPGSSEWEQQRVATTVERLKLNEHAGLAEARRKVWRQVNDLINDYLGAKSRSSGNNAVARDRMKRFAKQIYDRTRPDAELSAVSRCCVLFRNDHGLSRLVA